MRNFLFNFLLIMLVAIPSVEASSCNREVVTPSDSCDGSKFIARSQSDVLKYYSEALELTKKLVIDFNYSSKESISLTAPCGLRLRENK